MTVSQHLNAKRQKKNRCARARAVLDHYEHLHDEAQGQLREWEDLLREAIIEGLDEVARAAEAQCVRLRALRDAYLESYKLLREQVRQMFE